jgi:hypothetical protein
MGFDVGDLFGNLFGSSPPRAIVTVPEPVANVASHATSKAVTSLAALPITAGLAAMIPFDDLPLPGTPCPRCGSLEEWTDLFGRRRCGVCERATLDKAIQWADRAARLQNQSRQRKPTPQDSGCCGSGGVVERKTSGAIGDYRGHQRAL